MEQLYIKRTAEDRLMLNLLEDDHNVVYYKFYNDKYERAGGFVSKDPIDIRTLGVKSLLTLQDYLDSNVEFLPTETNHANRRFIKAFIEDNTVEFEMSYFDVHDNVMTIYGNRLFLSKDISNLRTKFEFTIIGDSKIDEGETEVYYLTQFAPDLPHKVTSKESTDAFMAFAKAVLINFSK